MRSIDYYSKTAMERAMKIQEVILRAMAKKITWWQAAEILGLATGICAGFANGMSSLAMNVCSTGAAASPPPSACPTRR